MDTSDEWITTRTGIRQRRFCGEGESATTLAVTAARQALERSGLSAAQIGCCVCATLSGEYASPSMACLVQKELGLARDIPVLDVNAACSGFIYAAAVARGLLAMRPGDARRYALVIGCEQLSRLMDMTDRNTCVLFGDGAGAAVFELAPDVELAVDLGARGDFAIETLPNGPIRMDGKAVFRFAVGVIPSSLNRVMAKAGLTMDQIDWVVCHQANARIIDHCAKKLGAPEKFYKNIDRYGNTSAASVPLALYDMWQEGLLKDGQKVLAVGFGGGLTWAGALLNLSLGAVK